MIIDHSLRREDAAHGAAFGAWWRTGAAIAMAAATVVLDGLDNQTLGLVAPALIKEWGIDRDVLGNIFAFGFVGMMFGTLVSGTIGDRIGRRAALLFGVFVFALSTFLTGFTTNIVEVALLRALSGVGLGGVPGTAGAYIAELAPRRWRNFLVTTAMVCTSIGGMLGGILATMVVPSLGWRWLFYVSGGVTFAALCVLWLLLPESPAFLAQKRAPRDPEKHASPIPSGDAMPPFRDLFVGSLRRDTIALSIAMLSGLCMVYLLFSWTPTLLYAQGLGLGEASSGLTMVNIGGIAGAVCASLLMSRVGPRPPLIAFFVLAALVSVSLASLHLGVGTNILVPLILLLALGFTANGAQSALYAVGTNVFPTGLRARGMGFIGAAGRVGALTSAVIGSHAIAGGPPYFFGLIALLMVVNAGCLVALRRGPA